MQEPNEAFQFPSSLDQMDDHLKAAHSTPFTPRLLFDSESLRTISQQLLLEASSIQWLVTWVRSLHGTVQMDRHADESPLDGLRRSSDTLAGAVLGLLPSGTVDGTSKQILAKFKDAFFKHQSSWPDLSVHAHAALLCMDSMPAEIALPSLLYPDRQDFYVADRSRFGIVTDKFISSVTSDENIRGAITQNRDRLTTVLHELFKNTHDHARTNADKTPIELSIRGLYARFYSARTLRSDLLAKTQTKPGGKPTDEAILKLNQAEQYALHFLDGDRQRPEGVRQKAPSNFIGLLELSVFDAGPGFAATYLKESFHTASVQEQFDAVLGCFQTGKSSTEDESRGYGLWKVLRDLRAMKGFIRVRTNRINVYRDFARFEDMWIKRGSVVAPEEILLDWKRGLTSKIGEGYPDMQGAQISILIPLGDNL